VARRAEHVRRRTLRVTLPDDVDARVDELYCLPLDRFVPERDALVRALRAEGRREEAAAVAKLAKPSVAAWAVNQVVRSQGAAASVLWEAGDAMLSGEDLRGAMAAQRAALTPLADAARGMLTARGTFLNEQAVQQVIETLHAAAVDPEARAQVAQARLARPLRLSGLGALPAVAAARGTEAEGPTVEAEAPPAEAEAPAAEAEAAPPSRAAHDAAAEQPPSRAAREAAAEERRAAKERERVLAAARRRLDRAVRARDRARERVEARRAELAAAEAELAEREEEVRAAEAALDE
jgi:hypothetical protein